MKTYLLLIAFIISMFSFSQMPTDAIRSYSFTNGSLLNTGTMTGGDLTTSGTSFTQVADFDGNANSALDMNGDVFNGGITTISNQENSYSLWIKVDPTSTGTARILNHRESGNNGVFIYIQNTNITCQFGDSTGNSKIISSPAINDGLWHHLTVVIEQVVTPSNFRVYEGTMYIDGVSVATDLTNGTSASGNPNWLTFFTNPTFSLNDTLSNAVFYQDAIDEVKVFDRVLTTAEITALATNNSNPPLTQVYVDADATGNNDGTSWADAFTSLQTALQLNPGAEFWVADGTYTPGTQSSDTFDLNTANTVILGGFNGTETMISERNPAANPTILSGDLNGDDTTVDFTNSSRSENSINVVTISQPNCVLDGLTVSDGHAIGTTAATGEGAAIFATTGDITINNCVFENHVVQRGGTIRVIDQNGTVNIENTVFRDNLGINSTLFYSRASGGLLDVNFTNCVVYNNRKEGDSSNVNNFGLVWLRQDVNGDQTATFTNCTFTENTFNAIGTVTPVINGSKNGPGNITVEINNSIFWRNRNITNNVNTAVAALGNGTNMQSATVYDVQNSIDDNTFSNISNNGGTRININNISSNPLFTDATTNDYTLQSGSPAIDAGDNQFVNATVDLAGNTRIVNTTVDMGAYEFGSSSTGPSSNDFIWTWRTTNANEVIRLPYFDSGSAGFNYTVDWGDGSVDSNTYTLSASHTYAVPGDYDITITGNFPFFFLPQFGEQDKCIDIKQWGSQQWTSLESAFRLANNFSITAQDSPDLSQLNNNGLFNTFSFAPNFNSDIGHWNVTGIQSFESCFEGATSFNQDISSWDMSSATNLQGMFEGASAFNQPLNNWDVSNATNFASMFQNASSFNQDLNSWDVSNATILSSMFRGASSFNSNITTWDVSSAVTVFNMFWGASSFNQDISGWRFTSTTSLGNFFKDATSFNQDISSWDMSNITDIQDMFFNAQSFNQDLSNWDTSSITSMRSSFRLASSFNQDISNWNTSNVTDMFLMFGGATTFNQDLSTWDITSLTNASNMFGGSAIDSNNYSRLLQGWSGQAITNSVTLSVGPQYCTAAQPFRDVLTNVHGWTIIDGGVNASANCILSNESVEFLGTVALFPNPATSEFIIELDQETVSQITMYNLQGQLVKTSTTDRVNVSELSNGIYLVKVITTSGATATKQLIKK